MATKKPEWRYHTVEVGGNRGNGFSGQKVKVRTDGTNYEKCEEERLELSTSLKTLAEQVARLLAAQPNADVRQKPEPYTDHDHYHVAQWWTPLQGDDPMVTEVLEQARLAEERQRDNDARELDRLQRERPDLFKK